MNCKRLLMGVFALSLVFSSCKKEDPTPTPEPTNPSTNTPSGNNYFLSHTVNGSVQTFEDTKNNYYWGYTTSYNFDSSGPTPYIFLDLGGGPTDINATGASGATVIFHNYSNSSQAYSDDKAAAMASIFTVGSHPYDFGGSTPAVSVDAVYNSVIYDSKSGPQPSGSTFTVTQSTAAPDGPMGETRQHVKGTYSCRLFNQDNPSDFIDVTNGSFYAKFEAW